MHSNVRDSLQRREYFGLAGGGGAWFVLENLPRKGAVCVVAAEDGLSRWRDNISALSQLFSPVQVCLFSGKDSFGRLETLNRLRSGRPCIVVATPESLAEKTVAPGEFSESVFTLSPGGDYGFNRLIDALARLGYERVDFVEERGQFSRRGEILDVWSPDQPAPWRAVFAHDTLETVRSFDIVTQRSQTAVGSAQLIPVKEHGEVYLDAYLPAESVLFFDVPPAAGVPEEFLRFPWLVNEPLATGGENDAGFRSFARWGGNTALFAAEYRRLLGEGYRVVCFAANQGERDRVEEILFAERLPIGDDLFHIGPLADGFYSLRRALAVFSAQEVLYKRRPVSFPKFRHGRRLEGLWEISPGDYVVHEKYGIGRYLGLRKIARGEHASEYLSIEYKGGDKLYVPLDGFRSVQKYVGLEGYRPRLYSMDTGLWERVKQRARRGAEELAGELLKLYAVRKNAPGYAYKADNHWERELADTFPYQETEDQMRAIEEVKRDLQEPRPMERLICGDVGFGKTEVAVRAAFKVVQDSRQVAVLVPTTVLAEQHYNTFANRLAPFPVRVQMLSRFQSPAEQKKVIADLRDGLVDIVVGTHRLLSKDVKFRDLGLLVIDEEHRFGVKQKEVIKSLRRNIDVLLLSATPIPRTLSMALSNMRELSVIETPPYGRLPIETHLGPYDEEVIRRIVQAELARGGQVFYVYNRVETILSRARHLQQLIPDIRWGVIHGQLKPAEIERIMWLFLHREIDVLIATTIIESGLDIPSVNTMIIEEAENFGLAQLYQLRGRIGRERQKAYCYLFYTPSMVSEDARHRLQALQELSELGSGFRLALRDLEIRGAGNILSGRQHGFLRDVGFELYSRLIDEASRRLRGGGKGAVEEQWETTIDLSLSAYLPGEYVQSEDLRILFYRRFAEARDDRDLDRVREELRDRFGRLPEAAENLFALTRIRQLAARLRMTGLAEKEHHFVFYFSDRFSLGAEGIQALAARFGDRLEFVPGEQAGLRIRKDVSDGKDPAVFVADFLKNLSRYATIN